MHCVVTNFLCKNSMNLINFFFPLKIKSSALTDKGKKRKHNEDSILADNKHHLYIVADGIGGHINGAYASSESINVVKDYLFSCKDKIMDEHESLAQVNFENASDIGSNDYPELNHLIHAIDIANESIYNKTQENQDETEEVIPENDAPVKKKGMGTTFVGCWFLPKRKRVILFNVGDSRAYLIRNNEMSQKTHDHSALQHWKDNGHEGPKPKANVIIRAIGPREHTQADFELAEIKKGDTWLICSDGLHGMLSDEELAEFLLPRLEDKSLVHYGSYASRLVDKANYAGGMDNVSVILVHVV